MTDGVILMDLPRIYSPNKPLLADNYDIPEVSTSCDATDLSRSPMN
jgi:hypothetical protein